MLRKIKYSDELKKKVILEALRDEKTINEISSIYKVHKTTIRDWKRQFLENMELAINPDKASQKYREKLKELQNEKDELYKQLGKVTSHFEWAKKKSREFGLECPDIDDNPRR